MKANLFGLWHVIAQRPHHLSAVLAGLGFEVDVFNFKGLRSINPELKISPTLHTSLTLPNSLYKIPFLGKFSKKINYRIREKVFSNFISLKSDLYIHYNPPAKFSSKWNKQLPGPLIYDCMDDWEGFSGADPEVRNWERDLCERADQVWVVSRHLEQKLSYWKEKVRYIPNGVDYQHFSRAKVIKKTSEKPKLNRKRLLYIGTISEWFDANLVGEVAGKLSDWQIDLVGPCQLSVEQRTALDKKNINFRLVRRICG